MIEATAATTRLLTAVLRRRDLLRLASILPCSSSKFPFTPTPHFARISMLAAAPSMESHELLGSARRKMAHKRARSAVQGLRRILCSLVR